MTKRHKGHDKGHKGQMSDREVMKLAANVLANALSIDFNDKRDWYSYKHDAEYAASLLRQALERPSDIEAAVLAEREACAEIAYSMAYSEDEAEEIAKAIRARMK